MTALPTFQRVMSLILDAPCDEGDGEAAAAHAEAVGEAGMGRANEVDVEHGEADMGHADEAGMDHADEADAEHDFERDQVPVAPYSVGHPKHQFLNNPYPFFSFCRLS